MLVSSNLLVVTRTGLRAARSPQGDAAESSGVSVSDEKRFVGDESKLVENEAKFVGNDYMNVQLM